MILKILIACLICFSSLTIQAQNTITTMKTTENGFTCKLTTSELQKRKDSIIADLKSRILERTELDNGVSYRFYSNEEMLDKINSFIKTEMMCCDFFSFDVVVDKEAMVLRITGPEGVKDFLKAEIDL
jgi:hypothetical protein